MAQGTGSDPVLVIISQTIRLALVAIILPFGLFAVDGWPEVARQQVLMDIGNPASVVRLAIIGVASAWVCRALRVQNPKFMGPLTVAASLAVSGIGPVPYPPAILALAQVILGTWLGANFNREIITSSVRLLVIRVFSSLLLLSLCSISATLIAVISGVDWQTLVLGAVPGGAVEMGADRQIPRPERRSDHNLSSGPNFHLHA